MKKEWIEAQRMLQKCIDKLAELKGKEAEKEYADAVEAVRSATGVCNQKKLLYEASRAAAESGDDDKEFGEKARRFSITKFVREAKAGSLTGIEAEMNDIAKKEAESNGVKLRGFGIPAVVLRAAFGGNNVGTPADGGHTVGSTMQYQEALRSKLVLAQAGAQYISGLQGDIDLITGQSITSGWGTENQEMGDSKKTFNKETFGPKRNYINVPVSIQLIEQSSFDVEMMLWNDILNAHAQLIDEAAICGTGAAGQPTGILNTTGIGAVAIAENGGAATFGKMVELETAVGVANADMGALSYVTNAKVRGALKTTLKAAGVAGYIWESNEVNGYKAYCSNLVPSNLTKGTAAGKCSATIFGNFNDLIIGSWGGLDIIVDPYTSKKMGAIELTLNAYNNVIVKRPESFAAIKDIIA